MRAGLVKKEPGTAWVRLNPQDGGTWGESGIVDCVCVCVCVLALISLTNNLINELAEPDRSNAFKQLFSV